MKIYYSYKAAGWLANVSSDLQDRIEEKMYFFANQKDPLIFAKFISTRGMRRFRIGKYRVFFVIEDNSIKVAEIERRDKAYD